MIFRPKTNDNDEEDDFFNSEIPDEKPKPQKQPVLKPENPDYWDKEDPWDHLRPARKTRFWIWLVAGGLAIGILYAIFLRTFTPYEEGAVQYGYVEKISSRGEVFKTFEGVLLPYRSLADTVVPYEGDLHFSVTDDHVAARLRRLHLANLPARIEYSVYRSKLPWRGETTVLVTAADTADVAKIYPPLPVHDTIPHP